MGNNGSTNSGQFISAESDFAVRMSPGAAFASASAPITKLKFHAKHGDHVDISQDSMVAKRIRSYCKGIVFTNRPVQIGEMVCFRVKEQSSKQQQWSGSLRIGLTIHNPDTISDLTSPDLTNREGFWAKPLPDSCATVDNIIHFQCQPNGSIVFGVNGEAKGLAFENIDTTRPLWAVFDIYGTTVAIELLDSSVLDRLSERSGSRSIIMGLKHRAGLLNLNDTTFQSYPAPHSDPSSRNPSAVRTGIHLSNLSRSSSSIAHSSDLSPGCAFVTIPPYQQNVTPATPTPSSSSRSTPVTSERNTNNVRFRSVHFSQLQLKCIRFNRDLTGRNAVLTDEGRSARLAVGEFNNGYVFLPRTMILNETLVIRIEENDWDFDGGLAFGLTTCDPSTLCQGNLPDDADNLLDRLEYWIVAKDVATRPKKGDEFAFTIKTDGAVSISKNNAKRTDFLYVDPSQPFWMFFELYGTTRKISLLGYTAPSTSSNSQPQSRLPASVSPSPALPTSQLTVNLPRTQSQSNKASPTRPPPAQNSRPVLSADRPPLPLPRGSSSQTGGLSDLIDFTVDLPSASPRSGSAVNSSPYGRNLSQPAVATTSTGRTSSVPSIPGRKAQMDRSNSDPVDPTRDGECCICFENPVNSVVYTCGHTVMCYDCAISHFRNGKLCPICRGAIKDIIKTYRT